MDIPLDKAVPRAIAAAVVVYCLWPILTSFFAKPKANTPEKLPELTAAMLSPKLPPHPERNPFVIHDCTSNSDSADRETNSQYPARAAGSTQSTRTAYSAQRASAGGGRSGGKFSVDSNSGGNRDGNPVLEATLIAGNQRVAVINGRVYSKNDRLHFPRLSNSPCVIVGVQPYKVLLKCANGKTATLTYSNANEAGANNSRAAPTKSKGE